MRRMNGDKGRKGSRKILTWSLLIGLAGALLVTSWQNTVLGREKEEIQNGWTGRSRRGSPGRSSVSMLLPTVTAKKTRS